MRTMLTSVEAAKASGVSASTFRAYVARGQAPRPSSHAGGVNLWSVTDLAAWRELTLSPEQQRAVRADVARRFSRGRGWEDATRRQLATVTLESRTAQALIDGTVLRDLPLEVYLDASHILEVRLDLRRRLAQEPAHASPITSESGLLREAADRVGAGEDVFVALADLTDALTAQGLPELLTPKTPDPGFWDAQASPEGFYTYLQGLERMWLPEVLR